MSNPIHCPKCKSEQVFVQKRGFSAGKATASVVLTGGVGALAGLHGSNKIDMYCLSCGNKWDPIKQSQTAKIERTQRQNASTERWKKRFYKAYEEGDTEQADAIISKHLGKLVRRRGLDEAYRSLRRMDGITLVIQTVFLALFLGVVVWIIS